MRTLPWVGAVGVVLVAAASCGGEDEDRLGLLEHERPVGDASRDVGRDVSLPIDAAVDAPIDTGIDVDAGPLVAPVLAAGKDLGCAIDSSGRLRCWGRLKGTPEGLFSGSTFVDVTIAADGEGGATTCAVRSDGSLLCWNGWNAPFQTAGSFKNIGLGSDKRCAITSDGGLACGPLVGPTLAAVGTDRDWARIASGKEHQCALKTSAALFCWGSNGAGETGTDTDASVQEVPAPTAVMPGTAWLDVGIGPASTCAVRSDGVLLCWGAINEKRLPTVFDPAKDWSRVSLGSEHACALKSNGTLYCWGKNGMGQLGLGDRTDRTSPAQVGADTDWRAVAAGDAFTCASKEDGSVRCWGNDSAGQLGRGTTHVSPTKIGGTEWKHVSAGGGATCAVRTNGTLACWGRGGVLGANASDVPAAIENGTTWSKVAVNRSTAAHACVIDASNALHCWGQNGSGQVGVAGTTIALPKPTGRTVKDVSAGLRHTCAVANDDALYCWGEQGGNALPADAPTPTKIGNDTWLTVGAADGSTCGVKSNGSMWCWGQGGWGLPPKQHGTSTTWSFVVAGAGTLRMHGIEGGNMQTFGSGGAPFGNANGVKSIAAGSRHYCAIANNGSLVCAGDNRFGEVGDGTIAARATPVTIGSATDWTMIAAGETHTCGLRGGGDLYCWGSNRAGEIGDGTLFSTTPVLVR